MLWELHIAEKRSIICLLMKPLVSSVRRRFNDMSKRKTVLWDKDTLLKSSFWNPKRHLSKLSSLYPSTHLSLYIYEAILWIRNAFFWNNFSGLWVRKIYKTYKQYPWISLSTYMKILKFYKILSWKIPRNLSKPLLVFKRWIRSGVILLM